MKRILMALVAGAVLLTAMPAVSAPVPTSETSPVIYNTVNGAPRYLHACRSSKMEYWKDHGSRVKETKAMVRCLAHKFKPPGGVSKAMRVADCESGFYAKAGKGSTYQGVYQLGDAEFASYGHQGSKAWDQEMRRNNWFRPAAILNARANTIAALAHASSSGWGAWSCQ